MRLVPDLGPIVTNVRQQVHALIPMVMTAGRDWITDLVWDTAMDLANDPPTAEDVVNLAYAVVGEAAGAPGAAVLLLDTTIEDALTDLRPAYSPYAGAAARLKNYDPDMLLGNDDVDDPDLVPPLFATLDTIPVTPLDDDALGIAAALYGSAETGDDGPTAGCGRRRTYQPAAPTWGVKMYVLLKAYKCTGWDDDPFEDYWGWRWDGKVTNETVNGEVFTRIWRFKYRTELTGAAYRRDDHDPRHDQSGSGSWQLHWQVGYGGTGSVALSGDLTVRKAKKIHPMG
jgi:hypothetical protein